MASLGDVLSQNQPRFQTRQALLVIGLQNDFVTSEGRLPVDTKTGFLERIQTLIPKFRELSGNVIWVQTLYEVDRIAAGTDTGEGDTFVVGGLVDGDEGSSEAAEDELAKEAASLPAQSKSSKHKQRALDLLKRVSARRKTLPKEVAKAKVEEDEELFLLKSEKRTPACVPNTHGAEFADAVTEHIKPPADVVIKTTNYSAFQGTNLLMTLRARLVTELFICGCMTNVSVLATVIDAARHGIKVHVVGDCLGFRKENRHDLSLKRMQDYFNSSLVNSEEILNDEPLKTAQTTSTPENGAQGDETVEKLMGKMSLACTTTSRTAAPSSTKVSEGSLDAVDAKAATGPGGREEDTPALVKTKIRQRKSRKSKKKSKDKQESKDDDDDDEGPNNQPSTSTNQGTNNPPPPTTASPVATPPSTSIDSQQTSKTAEAGIVADLEEKDGDQGTLKDASSVPELSGKTDGEEKEKNGMSPSDAPKSELEPESNKEFISSAQAAAITSKQDVREIEQPTTKAAQSEQSSASTQEADMPSIPTSKTGKPSKVQSLATFPVLGPGDHIAEGDSRIISDFFPVDLSHPSVPSQPLKDVIFTQLYNEVRWQKMLHQQGEVPRLVCCQGAFGDDGSMPVYRHPADQTLPLLHFSPKVHVIRKQAEKLVGHPLNHVLIQLYRSGNDFISEHSDKTLDIVKGSSIVNVSFGSQRTMRLRTKRSQSKTEDDVDSITAQRETQRVAMPHNSMFVLGLKSNAKWLHSIQPDKRLPAERSETEKAYNGIRISLTFRHIGTFLDAKETVIWGQGATAKIQRDAADIVSNDETESKRLITAFSRENHSSDFSWDEHYGDGFDVLHLHSPPPADVPLLFLSNNPIENKQVIIGLAEAKLQHNVIEAPPLDAAYELDRQVTFRDVDTQHTEIHTSSSILMYLDRYHPLDTSPFSHSTTANAYPTMLLTADILKAWSNRAEPGNGDGNQLAHLVMRLEENVEMTGGPFIAGPRFSIADSFVWPVIDVLIGEWEGWSEQEFAKLTEWYMGCWKKKASVKKVAEKLALPVKKVDAE